MYKGNNKTVKNKPNQNENKNAAVVDHGLSRG